MANSVLAKMAVQISANTAEFSKALAQTSNQLNSFQKTTQTVNTVLQSFGVGFGVYQIANGIKAAIGVFAEFEQTMSEVKAITGATGLEFERLRNDSIRLAGATKFTSNEIAGLQVAFGRLGFTTGEILAATEATIKLAQATGEDLAKAADTAGSTIRGFGLDASETERVVDVMASSFNKTALGLENFTESMKYVAPIANAAGVSVEETTALLGVLADAGIRGSQAGTSLRKIFGDLSKDGRPVQERLAELSKTGITLADSYDEVGRTAQTALLVISKSAEKVNELTTAFRNSKGEADAMSKVMQDNLLGDVNKLTAAWQQFLIVLGSSEALRSITQLMTKLVQALGGDTVQRINEQTAAYKEIQKVIADFAKFTNIERARDLALQEWNERLKKVGEEYDKVTEALNRQKEAQKEDINNTRNYDKEINKLTKEQTALQNRYNDLVNSGGLAISEFYNKTISGAGAAVTAITPLVKKFHEIFVPDIGFKPKELADEVEKQMNRIKGIMLDVRGSVVDFSEANQSAIDSLEEMKEVADEPPKFTKWSKEFADMVQGMKERLEDIRPLLIEFGTDLFAGFGEAIAGVTSFGDAFLSSISDFMKALGRQMIAMGVAKLVLDNINKFGFGAVGGVALIAAGVALSAASAAIGKARISGGSGGSSVRGNNTQYSNQYSAIQSGAQNTIATTVIRGQDLYVVLQNYMNNNKSTRG